MWREISAEELDMRQEELESRVNAIYDSKRPELAENSRTNAEAKKNDGFWYKEEEIEELEKEQNTYKQVKSWGHEIPKTVEILNDKLKTSHVGTPLTEFIMHIETHGKSDENTINSYLNQIAEQIIPETIGLNYKFETKLSEEEKKEFEKFKYVKGNTKKQVEKEKIYATRLKESLHSSPEYHHLLELVGDELNEQSKLFGMFEIDRVAKHLRITKDEKNKIKINHIDFGSARTNIPIQMQAYKILDTFIPYHSFGKLVGNQLFYNEEIKGIFLNNIMKYVLKENNESKVQKNIKEIWQDENIDGKEKFLKGIHFSRFNNNVRELDYLMPELKESMFKEEKTSDERYAAALKAFEFAHHYNIAIKQSNLMGVEFKPLTKMIEKEYRSEYNSIINSPEAQECV